VTTPTTISQTVTATQTSTQTATATSTTTAQPPSLTVESVNQDGQAITGYWTVLRIPGTGQVGTGYTPRTYTGLTPGSTYTIELDSFGSCTFSHWQDTSSTTDPRSFVASGAQTFIGVFDCIGGAEAPAGHANGGDSSVVLTIGFLLASFAISMTAIAYRSNEKKSRQAPVNR
jgi:hypothetical protein